MCPQTADADHLLQPGAHHAGSPPLLSAGAGERMFATRGQSLNTHTLEGSQGRCQVPGNQGSPAFLHPFNRSPPQRSPLTGSRSCGRRRHQDTPCRGEAGSPVPGLAVPRGQECLDSHSEQGALTSPSTGVTRRCPPPSPPPPPPVSIPRPCQAAGARMMRVSEWLWPLVHVPKTPIFTSEPGPICPRQTEIQGCSAPLGAPLPGCRINELGSPRTVSAGGAGSSGSWACAVRGPPTLTPPLNARDPDAPRQAGPSAWWKVTGCAAAASTQCGHAGTKPATREDRFSELHLFLTCSSPPPPTPTPVLSLFPVPEPVGTSPSSN
uniref:Uncharacterized protein n=1 Tax=Myotis myotis TaxID=51298 RepID=A0A7J7Z5M3_MYOMY|nr:hypothetical protein mMyoMyo1_010796 [Myotis myotis]